MSYKKEQLKMQTSIPDYEGSKLLAKKFVSLKEGAMQYSMSWDMFRKMAKDAEALYRVGDRMLLVNTEVFDKYLEGFRLFQTR